jgi:hypothetical protein
MMHGQQYINWEEQQCYSIVTFNVFVLFYLLLMDGIYRIWF